MDEMSALLQSGLIPPGSPLAASLGMGPQQGPQQPQGPNPFAGGPQMQFNPMVGTSPMAQAVRAQQAAPANSPLQRQATPQPAQGPGSITSPLDPLIAQRQARADAAYRQYQSALEQQASGIEKQSQSESALKDLLKQTQERLGNLQYGPDQNEMMLRVGSAMAGPVGLGADLGRGAGAAAQGLQQRREGALLREELQEKLGIGAAQADMMVQQLQTEAGRVRGQGMLAMGQGNEKAAETLTQSKIADTMRNANNKVAITLNTQGAPTATPNAPLAAAEGAIQLAKSRAIAAGFNPDAVEAQAKMIANGDSPPITGYALTRTGSPGLMIMQRANEIHQEQDGRPYDATLYAAKQQAQNHFAAGTNAQTINSLGVGLQHLGVLEDISHDLTRSPNSQTLNAFMQGIQKEFGLSTAPTSFDAALDILRAEIPKAIVGGRTALEDRKEAEHVLSRVSTPDQLGDAIHTVERLFAGQLTGQRAWYERAVEMNHPSGNFDQNFIGRYPRALAILKPLEAGNQVTPRDVSDANGPSIEEATAEARRRGLIQ